MTVREVLDFFRREALSNRDLGDKFERLIAQYLVTDPIYADQYDAVWVWPEWPYRWGSDTGIDIVARERLTGDYCAVQCKFFDPAHTLQKGDIDAFFTASGKKFSTPQGVRNFTHRVIVSTTDKWSHHAEEALSGQAIPVTRLGVQDLDESPVDWTRFRPDRPGKLFLRTKRSSRPHQKEAIADVLKGFKAHDRGKLIMACGTGKTFISLKIAENLMGKTGIVLFLVPSISLLSQALREWTAETDRSFHAFAVCSDTKVGRHQEDISAHDLALPATTNPKRLADAVKILHGKRQTSYVFSTYQSISVVSDAQKAGLPEFDIIVCDEAHRTAGVTLEGEDESEFVRVHNQQFIRGKKRLYMTATPRIYADSAKSKAEEYDAALCSMDDESLYGPTFHRLGFGNAVERGLLSDYKVLVLAVDEKHVSKAIQSGLAAGHSELKLEDAIKIVGCWNGLSKRFVGGEGLHEDPAPMRRAVAFSRSIKDSKHLAAMFQSVISEYVQRSGTENGYLKCEADHVDGTFNVLERNRLLDWLKQDTGENVCRILSNARCLSEGVDVPALDAVLFLNPRDSVIDVVQSVGRVMRRVEGKKYGYVILPIGVPSGIPPEEALKDNEKYRVVWQVLQALRAHDDRFNATVNQIELNKRRPEQIQVIGVGGGEGEVGEETKKPATVQFAFAFPDIEAWKDAIFAKIVLRCGDRRYWEDWAKDVAGIAERHTARIQAIVEGGGKARKAFDRFVSGLRENINPSIGEDDAVEMLSQHLVTRPVFDALFENYSFAKRNPVSLAMQDVLDVLEAQALEKEVEALKGFYESVRQRVKGIDNAEGRQKVVVELYDKFFKLAFPRMSERLGIVYTPVEVVNFIVQSAEDALRKHFTVGLTDKNVHVLDPFTGTGTFIVRLLQSGLIKPKDLERKFREELHANEIVLLAYYIAAINIEETYHGLNGGAYEPFEGIVLTDTFQLGEEGAKGGLGEIMFPENDKRVQRQKGRDIRVILGNPPYSAQQESENLNNKNLSYPMLDERIRTTYAASSTAKLLKNLYDSYIRAIRWTSDRIKNQGVIGFVTNGSFVDANNMDGLRKCLSEEFSTIYCFNLRGDARTQGERRRKEKGNVFGGGTRTPVAITLLVKDPSQKGSCKLLYHDIGDYLSREDKLRIIGEFGSIKKMPWKAIFPNEGGDWINQRNPEFDKFMPLGDKAGGAQAMFDVYSQGVLSARDAWVYNFSKTSVRTNMRRMIDAFNEEVERFKKACKNKPKGEWPAIDQFVDSNAQRISWTGNLKTEVLRHRQHTFEQSDVVQGHYRPFTKNWMYFNRRLNERVYKIPLIFPTPKHDNIVLAAIGIGAKKAFSVLATNSLPDYEFISKGQCFPLFWYQKVESSVKITNPNLFKSSSAKPDAYGYIRRDAITDWALEEFRKRYGDKSISKEDIFYYVYGLLHSPCYREKYESSLSKMLPRIPFAADFRGFAKAGLELAKWHLGYETVKPWPLAEQTNELALVPKDLYRVEKMVFAKSAKAVDKSAIVFNSRIRLTGIPAEAYEYVVNGKSAIEWIMERYAISVDKGSGIKNDPNTWSDDPRYIIDLLKRVVRVSIETVRIVRCLPAL